MVFHYQDETLFAGQFPISEIAEKIGTPFYVYLLDEIVERTKKLKEAFRKIGEGNYIDCVPVKTLANLTFLEAMAKEGCGADVASKGELTRVLFPKVRMDPNKIVMTGPGKSHEDITAAIDNGILLIVAESLEELRLINKIAETKGVKVSIACRVNPDIDVKTFTNLAVGLRKNQFGIAHEESTGYQPGGRYITSIFKDAKELPHLIPTGIHFHIGSQISNLDAILQATKLAVEILKTVRKKGIETIKYFGIGGGLPIAYQGSEEFILQGNQFSAKDLDQKIFEVLIPKIINLVKPTGCKIWTEIGRFRVGPYGALITRVLYRKTMPQKDGKEKIFYILEAGMNDLIRPAMYGDHVYHQILPVIKTEQNTEIADFAGWCCESSDKFGHDRLTPQLKQGDLVAILCAGAYGTTMSSNYCGRPLCPEVFIFSDSCLLARRRQSDLEMMSLELEPEEL